MILIICNENNNSNNDVWILNNINDININVY